MNKEKLKDLIFTAQCAIGEYSATTLDDDLLDKACDLLEEALEELKDYIIIKHYGYRKSERITAYYSGI